MNSTFLSDHTHESELSVCGRAVLRAVMTLSVSARETLLFGRSGFCLPFQKVVHRCLGGTHKVRFTFDAGPMNGYQFECFSTEKYFFMRERFEREEQDFIRGCVSRGIVAYDVGGHIGFMALFLASLGADVVTFEPSPGSFVRLSQNLLLNRSTTIRAINAAASDVEGQMLLSDCGSMSQIGSVGLPIRTLRLDDFVYREGNPIPKFIKIDVEGHAGHVLSGMTRLLQTRPSMMLETHNAQEDLQVRERLGRDHGFRLIPLDTDHLFPRRIAALPK